MHRARLSAYTVNTFMVDLLCNKSGHLYEFETFARNRIPLKMLSFQRSVLLRLCPDRIFEPVLKRSVGSHSQSRFRSMLALLRQGNLVANVGKLFLIETHWSCDLLV